MLRVIFRPIPGGLPGLAVSNGINTTIVLDPDTRLNWALSDLSDLTAECLNSLLAAILSHPPTGTLLQLVG